MIFSSSDFAYTDSWVSLNSQIYWIKDSFQPSKLSLNLSRQFFACLSLTWKLKFYILGMVPSSLARLKLSTYTRAAFTKLSGLIFKLHIFFSPFLLINIFSLLYARFKSSQNSSRNNASFPYLITTSSEGITSVSHVLSTKRVLMILLILFLWYIVCDDPFCSSKEDSKYSLGLIENPLRSSIFSVKSLRTQNNPGSELWLSISFSKTLTTSMIMDKLLRVC